MWLVWFLASLVGALAVAGTTTWRGLILTLLTVWTALAILAMAGGLSA